MNSAPRARQTGIAALTAILVVAIATVLAVNLLWQTSVDLRRTETLLLQDQARQYDLGGEEFAKFGLAEDFRDDGPSGNDTLQENWAKPLVFDVEAGKLEGYLLDQQGRFDLNGLVGADGKRVAEAADQFERLLTLLPLERPLDSGNGDGPGRGHHRLDRSGPVARAEWRRGRPVHEPRSHPTGRQTSGSPPPASSSPSRGYTPEIYAALRPHVSALPPPATTGERWKLNVNTATDLVLASLVPNLGPLDVEPFLNGAYEDEADFRADFPGSEQIPPNTLGITSNWFLLTVTATIGTAQSTMYSLLERNGETVRTRLRTFDAN